MSLAQTVLLALTGGVSGCALAFTMNGFRTATGNTAGFSEIAFAFRVTPFDLALGLGFALAMGIAGGLLPSVRAARRPVSEALREA